MASIEMDICSISKLLLIANLQCELLSLLLFKKSATLIRFSIHSVRTCVYNDVVTLS